MTKRATTVLFVITFVMLTGLAGAAGVCIYQQRGPIWYAVFVIGLAWLGVLPAVVRKRRRDSHKSSQPTNNDQ